MQLLGHDGPPTAYWTENLITGAPLDRCPIRTLQLARESHPRIADEVGRYVETVFPAFEKGFLLVAGGISDQPARYVDLIDRIRATDAQVQRKSAALTADDKET